MGYIIPPTIMDNEFIRIEYETYVGICESAYKTFADEYGIPAEDARFLLPNATETQVVMTMNFRSWLHFLKLRTEPHAQWEIRHIAEIIYGMLKEISPEVFDEKYRQYWE
jgi:thymidylate synthase (FAD)